MAHDKQYKDNEDMEAARRVKRFDYPRTGDTYWDRATHSVKVADHDLSGKHLILEPEEEG